MTNTMNAAKTWTISDIERRTRAGRTACESPRSTVATLAESVNVGDRLSWHLVDYLHGLLEALRAALKERGLWLFCSIEGIGHIVKA